MVTTTDHNNKAVYDCCMFFSHSVNLSPLFCPQPAIPGSPGYQGTKGVDGPPGNKGRRGPNGPAGKDL